LNPKGELVYKRRSAHGANRETGLISNRRAQIPAARDQAGGYTFSWLGDVILPAGLYLCLSLVMTLPVALNPGEYLGAKGDCLLNSWILWRMAENLLSQPWALYEGNIFYPYGQVMAYSETMLSGALSLLPAHILGASPVWHYNLLKLTAFTLNGLGMYLLCRQVIPSRAAAFIGGLVFAFALPRYNLNLQMLCSHFMPFALWSLLRYLQNRRPRFAWYLAGFTLLTMASNTHYAVFVVYLLAGWFVLDLILSRGRGGLVRIKGLILPALTATGVGLWLFWPYLGLPSRLISEVLHYSNSLGDFLRPDQHSWFYGLWGQNLGPRQWFFGILPWLLAMLSLGALFCGKAAGMARWLAPAWVLGLLAAWGSLGPEGGLHGLMWDYLPGFKGIRSIGRLAMVSLLAVSLLSAHGAWLLIKRRRRAGWRLAAGLALLILLEAFSMSPLRTFYKHPTEAGREFAWLAKEEQVKNILYLHMKYEETYITYASAFHNKRMVNGYSGYYPPLYNWFKEHQHIFPHPDMIRALQAIGVDHLVVDKKRFEKMRPTLHKYPDLSLVKVQNGLALIRVKPRKIKLDQQDILAGRLDQLWRLDPKDLKLGWQVEPEQSGPLAKAVLQVRNTSPHGLPGGQVELSIKVQGAQAQRDYLQALPRLQPDQELRLPVNRLLPLEREQEVSYMAGLRLKDGQGGQTVSVRTRVGGCNPIKAIKAWARPNPGQAGKIIDGDPATRWTSGAAWQDGQEVVLEAARAGLKGLYLINQAPALGDHPTALQVFVSSDNRAWSPPRLIKDPPVLDMGNAEAVWLDLTGLGGRFIKIKSRGQRPGRWWSLHEVLILGFKE
jgi:hypothetical protein